MIQVRRMPWGVAVFLVYAFLILAGIGISLPYVIALAEGAPVSFVGIVVMVLLAYTVFTMTLTLQRKSAARGLALGLASLTVPPIPWALAVGLPIFALFFAALAGLLFLGLRSAAVRRWLVEP